jgi:uncharacterized membrane protein YdjX (TVP38/TMEM64 family)
METFFSELIAMGENEFLLAAIVFAATAAMIALWVPGVLLPIAASSGAVLDTWVATGAVSLGALAGSMIIFGTTRRLAAGHAPTRMIPFMERFEAALQARGAWLVLGLRLVGTPHFLVSSASALSPMRARDFAVATLAGMAPAILLASIAGSAF